MTMADVSVLRERILQYCDTARTKPEVIEHMGGDRQIIGRLFDRMVGEGKIMIAPGTASTSAMRWVVSAKAKAALKAMDGGQE